MMPKVEVGFLYRVGADMAEEVRPADGKKFTLEELQKFVGGYIEIVPYANPVAYCNEEGRLNGLPWNPCASDRFKQSLVGDVIQVRKEGKVIRRRPIPRSLKGRSKSWPPLKSRRI